MPERDLDRDVSAVAVPEQIGLFDVEVAQESDGLLGGLLEREWAIDVGRAAMALLLERDHPARPGQQREQLAERGADGRVPTVQEHQRHAVPHCRPVDLVVHLESVDGRVTALDGAGGASERETDEAEHRKGAHDHASSPAGFQYR